MGNIKNLELISNELFTALRSIFKDNIYATKAIRISLTKETLLLSVCQNHKNFSLSLANLDLKLSKFINFHFNFLRFSFLRIILFVLSPQIGHI